MEGIIFAGYFLTHGEFINAFTQYYKQKEKILNEQIDKLIKTLGNPKETKASKYRAWEKFSYTYFQKPETDILFGVSLNGEQYSWSKIIKEEEVLTNNTISMAKAMKNSVLENSVLEILNKENAQDLENIMQEHLKDLITSIGQTPTPYDISAYSMNPNQSYREQIYKNVNNVEGKILDAYLNHIGHYHQNILSYLKDISSYKTIEIKDKNIQEKEGTNFVPLLRSSLNNYGWYGGGDIIVYNENRKVIYNIQLKTSTQKNQKRKTARMQSYHIALKKLKNTLEEATAKEQPEEKAEILYNLLKNEAVGEAEKSLALETKNIVDKLTEPLKNLTK